MTAELKSAAFGGQITPTQLLADTVRLVGGAKCAVLVYLDDDGYIKTGWSDGSLAERLGLLDVAKHRMIVDATED